MIPKLHYISQGKTAKLILENVQKACTSGAELVQLDLNNVSNAQLVSVAQEARDITSHFQTRLVIKEHYKIAKEVKADGVHLEQAHTCPSIVRAHVYTWQIIGGTANTLKESKTLLEKQVDYILLSPFRLGTTTKKVPTVLGLDGYTVLTEALQTETPIIGFGSIDTADIKDILATGISGVAVSDAITNNFDSIKDFHKLLNASATEEMRHTF